jgi:hypothetical protein
MTSPVPVPQIINGYPVLAAIAVPARPGELPFQFIVICQQRHTPPGGGPYVTWRTGTRDGREWAAENGHYDLTWPQAVASLASRASLPAPAGPHLPAGPHTGDAPGHGGKEAGK